MKILFIGTVEFSLKALEKLIEMKANIVGVCTKMESNFNNDFADLAPICIDNNIPCKNIKNINSKDSLAWISELNPDIIFCFGWSSLIKKELFFPPLGWVLKWMGGIPVDRKNKTNLTAQLKTQYSKQEKLTLVVTPEGTRSYNPNWKKGFYMIALEAGVPIALSFIDYKNKTGGIGPIFHPTGDYEKDMVFIQDFYRDKTACPPERFNLSKQNTS